MSILSAKKAPAPSSTFDLEAKIARMEDRQRVLRIYGSGLTDAQVESVLEQERLQAFADAARKVQREESKRNEEARRIALEKAAAKYIAGGRILIDVDGTRYKSLGPDFTFDCKKCWGPIGIKGAIIHLATLWYDATPRNGQNGGFRSEVGNEPIGLDLWVRDGGRYGEMPILRSIGGTLPDNAGGVGRPVTRKTIRELSEEIESLRETVASALSLIGEHTAMIAALQMQIAQQSTTAAAITEIAVGVKSLMQSPGTLEDPDDSILAGYQ